MKVVLRNDIDKVGKRGDIVDVADGFGRNYLIPRGQAIEATKGITAQAAAMRAARDRADAKNREAAEAIAKRIVGETIRIEARSGTEGKLFGSVTNHDLLDALKSQTGIELERKQIETHDALKTVGSHEVPVRLHSDVQVTLNVEIVSSEA